MARIVVAVDKRGRKWKVTEEEAKAKGYRVVGKTATAEIKTKATSKPAPKKATVRKATKKK